MDSRGVDDFDLMSSQRNIVLFLLPFVFFVLVATIAAAVIVVIPVVANTFRLLLSHALDALYDSRVSSIDSSRSSSSSSSMKRKKERKKSRTTKCIVNLP